MLVEISYCWSPTNNPLPFFLHDTFYKSFWKDQLAIYIPLLMLVKSF